jgi:diguanylate cyclase (GGDEF)-like protein
MCGFAKWYSDVEHFSHLQDHAQFLHVGKQHQLMHDAANKLVMTAKDGLPLPTDTYDNFLFERNRFQNDVEQLERLLWDEACLIDHLTGLRNRHGMLLELCEEQQRISREGGHSTIGMFDLDYFKRINDQYGHKTGDLVLHEVAEFTIAHLRPYDRIYRYGGEEFLLYMPGCSLEKARQIIERLRSELAEHTFEMSDQQLNVTASFGLAELMGKSSAEMYIEQADAALYRAKQSGRNRVECAPAEVVP